MRGRAPQIREFDARQGIILRRLIEQQHRPVFEVKFLTWTGDNLLRQVVYEGLREDKPAAEIRRPVPYRLPAPPRWNYQPGRSLIDAV